MKLLLSIPLIVSALVVDVTAGGDAGKYHVPIFKCQLSNQSVDKFLTIVHTL